MGIGDWGVGVALGDSVAEFSDRTPGELILKLSGKLLPWSPPILTDIWHKAAILDGERKSIISWVFLIIKSILRKEFLNSKKNEISKITVLKNEYGAPSK